VNSQGPLPGINPYAGVSTAILVFTKTNSGSTDHVWFYDVSSAGWSLDDKRTPLLSEEKLGPVPKPAAVPVGPPLVGAHDAAPTYAAQLHLNDPAHQHDGATADATAGLPVGAPLVGAQDAPLTNTVDSGAWLPDDHAKNNLPDVLARWRERDGEEMQRPRTAESFYVRKADIVAQGHDLSLNRYKDVIHEEVEHRPPLEILADLARIELEIQEGMRELGVMLH
jgi:type I restriction enzyme M protein